jgi:hypothetical protein
MQMKTKIVKPKKAGREATLAQRYLTSNRKELQREYDVAKAALEGAEKLALWFNAQGLIVAHDGDIHLGSMPRRNGESIDLYAAEDATDDKILELRRLIKRAPVRCYLNSSRCKSAADEVDDDRDL